ncbi:MAG: NADH-quinone oxidoreductase subunit L [Candidatus Kapabacteria bacterium]|nr:NADH-quinone oxidoreductase subunit L [Candidatus Kapabacteria bacterium]
MHELIRFVPLMPLLGFLIISFFGRYLKKESVIGAIGSGTIGISFILSLLIFFNLAGSMPEKPLIVQVYQWIAAGKFSINISYQVDQLSILFSLIITGVGFLIHVYSIGYMHGDRSFYRFFAYLNLFIFMMLNLVLASNFLLTFVGWEGVGLCSYLLIGFWYDRKFEGTRITWTGDAANKAFIVNRIGDFGFIIGMFIIYSLFNTLDYQNISETAAAVPAVYFNTGLMTAATLLLFLGCTGKSAQIPLAVWLPDAMAGPTPVSALIHAATMVTSGIFLISRNAVLFSLSPTTMTVIAIVGVATAFLAATIGLVQNDIKKVLAYSTVSQLGFMFVALGVGAYVAGVFHVMTHAFFKGLLFLGSGSVIHGMHDEQNIKKMGGLKKYMPVTYKTFFVGTLAIAGIPLFSGFFSKDEILWMAYSQGSPVLWVIGATAALCTAFYMFRLLNLTFHGEERFDHHKIHPHESPKTMTIPLIVLAVLSALGGFLGIPYALGGVLGNHSNLLETWLEPIFKDAMVIMKRPEMHEVHIIEYVLMAISICIALFGMKLANDWYKGNWDRPRSIVKSNKFVYRMLFNKYKLDEFYFKILVDPLINVSTKFLWKFVDVAIIDGIVNGSAKITMTAGQAVRRIQTGVVQNYAFVMLIGIILILTALIVGI